VTGATIELVPIGMIRPHPSNPRIHATADEPLVESIRKVGLIDALLCVPDPDESDGAGVLVIDGHRRFDGCQKAGLQLVPCRVRDDLVTEAQQVEVMAITGLQKENLSPVEEAQAYEQLTLLGMDEAAIAASTGFSQRRVKARLRLTGLSTETRQRVHAGDATLTDVETMFEFADDPAATAELEEAIGTTNFQQRVHALRSRQQRLARRAELIEEYEAAGAVRAEQVAGGAGAVVLAADEERTERRARGMHMFPTELRSPAEHDGCLAYVVPESEWHEPYLICVDNTRHPAPATPVAPQPGESDWERRRAEREEREARFAAASAARRDWLAEHLSGLFPARGNKPLAALATVMLPLVDEDHDPADVHTASTTKVLAAFSGWLTGEVATSGLDRQAQWVGDADEALAVLAVWDWLTGAGYQLSDVDREQRTLMETRLAELTADEEAS
jgi:ParB/RepB/Spo0J family partition protein